MQDRIVGPLTLFQFLYLLAGGMIFYGTLKTPGAGDFILLGVPAGIVGLAFAFVKINDRPFSHFVGSLIRFTVKPKQKVWHHGFGAPIINVSGENIKAAKFPKKQLDPQKIKSYLGNHEKGGI